MTGMHCSAGLPRSLRKTRGSLAERGKDLMRIAARASARAAVLAPSPDAAYEVRAPGLDRPVLKALAGAKVDGRWLRSKDYPHRQTAESAFKDELGRGRQTIVAYAGLAGKPDLWCVLLVYDQLPFGDVEVRVRNSNPKPASVQAIRVVEAETCSWAGRIRRLGC